MNKNILEHEGEAKAALSTTNTKMDFIRRVREAVTQWLNCPSPKSAKL